MKKPLIVVFLVTVVFIRSNSQNILLNSAWQTDTVFFMSESAVYDSVRDAIYISNVNYKAEGEKDFTLFNECISKLDIDGNIENIRWIDSLLGPTGIAIYNDKLYAVERGYLAEIDIQNQKIIKHYPIPDFGFPNDIAFTKEGIAFITDSEKNCLYRFDGTSVSRWMSDSLFKGINALYLTNDTLLVGSSGMNCLLAVDLKSKVTTVKALNAVKFVDGIAPFHTGTIIGGETKITYLDSQGNYTVLINSNNNREWYADYYLIKDRNLLIVPTLYSNRVVAFRVIVNAH